jgi:hypothetical protein
VRSIVRIAGALAGSVVEHARDRYATHPLRRMVVTLGGLRGPAEPRLARRTAAGGGGGGKKKKKGKAMQHKARRAQGTEAAPGDASDLVAYECPETFGEALVTLVDEFFDRDPARVYGDLFHPQASPVLQNLVRIGDPESTLRLVGRLVAWDDSVGRDGATAWMYDNKDVAKRMLEMAADPCAAPAVEVRGLGCFLVFAFF